MPFSDKLRDAREKAGMTQQQVADKLGVDKSTYCGYETGKRQPDPTKIKMIAKIINASTDELLETGITSVSASKQSVQAAFWGGDKDLSQEDKDELWKDVQEYARFKAEQRKKRND